MAFQRWPTWRNSELSRTPRAILITVSDSVSRGEREDLSGPAARGVLEPMGFEVVGIEIVPDEFEQIRTKLLQVCQIEDIDLALTVGGTGLGPRDVTPEATLAVIEREVPGLPELMRSEGRKSTPLAALSRARSGIRHKTLILNLPGSVKGVTECLKAVARVLPHALDVVSGSVLRCGG